MQPEARLVRKIKEHVTARGGFIFKIHGSSTMMAGLPDLIVCYRGVFLGIEAKCPGNKPSKVQLLVHTKIARAGGTAIVAYSVQDAERALDAIDASFGRND